MRFRVIKILLRVSIALGFLSAVADRFGLCAESISTWGNWENFLSFTQLINPWFPESVIPAVATIATIAEIAFAFFLLIGFKTEFFARMSGTLLLVFGLSMTFSLGVKSAFDYSVFAASAAAFALSIMDEKYLEIDSILFKNKS